MTLQAQAIRDAVSAYYAAVRSRDIDRIAALFAADGVMRDPVGTPPAADETTRRQRYQGIAAAFDTFDISEKGIIVCGDEAAAGWTVSGRTRTGVDVRFEGMSTFVFDGRLRITSMSAYFDVSALVASMSAPSP
jgi:ketosteroid isomerase-like protein